MLLSLFLHDWIALFFLQNVRQANLTTEEANDARGAENVTELSSEEMRVEDCTNKVESSDFGLQNHHKYTDADKLELQNREIDISYILDTPIEKETNGRNSEKISESTEELIHQTFEISEENKAAVVTGTNMLQSCAGPQEQLKHQLAELGEEKQAGGIADTNTEKPYIAPVQEIIDKSETEDISSADCLEEENSLRTNQEKLKEGENSEVKTDENIDRGDEFQSIMMLKGVEKDDHKQHIKHNTCAVMDTEEQNEDSPAGEQTSKKLEGLEKVDIDDNNNINHQRTETNLSEEATESKSECVAMEIKTPIKEEEQEEDLRETTGEDSSNNTTQVQKEEETTMSEPERKSLEPFGSERKTAAGFGEMITCNETKVTEHFTSLKSVTVSEKEMDDMVSNESNTTKQIQEQAAYPLLTLEREETIPTSSTDANGTPKDSITPHVELGAEAKNIQYMQEKCKISETEQHQENYENKKEVECDSKEVPEESISRETQAKATLSDLVHVSTKEASKIEEDFAEEREGSDREEEGIQKTRDESSSEDPVIVEISKDADIKVPPKKHQNILSGVGSKVKHSIAKVKKAITGKSSQTKPSSPK